MNATNGGVVLGAVPSHFGALGSFWRAFSSDANGSLRRLLKYFSALRTV